MSKVLNFDFLILNNLARNFTAIKTTDFFRLQVPDDMEIRLVMLCAVCMHQDSVHAEFRLFRNILRVCKEVYF